ncbi:invasion associated locus B family protein [Rhizobium multihospitium]|uniref:Invasion protein IalB, involved in pathogenesis n=1 Tax=Rhizobium multihospitium TaxID=410764 RepID=A0A1C3W8I9_9HYPH|nr:invasion associated locus B family protein [Rhizobium multihospitium]SCB36300.1 Invasion protein IalB, involved in pathogenesis [Rhizobium multihospitium]
MSLYLKASVCCVVFLLWGAGVSSTLGADNSPGAPQSGTQNVTPDAGKSDPSNAVAPAPATSAPAGSQITEQKFDAWTLQCSADKTMKPRCQIVYRLTSPDQKQVFMVISMARSADKKIGMQMALPLGFAIQGGVKIGFGSKYSTIAKVSRCTTQGCLVEGLCPPEMLAALMKEKSGKVSIRMMQGNMAELPISLSGFGAAFQAMQADSG